MAHLFKQEAECEKLRMDAKYAADTKVADSKRMYEMQKAAFDMEVNARVSFYFGRSLKKKTSVFCHSIISLKIWLAKKILHQT